MTEVRDLRGTTMATLARASNEAFGDYAVDVQMTPTEIGTLCRQNAVSLEDSAGLFDGERLVGFWLNGIRCVDGEVHGYDAGTAICPEYRGSGAFSRLAELAERLARGRGVTAYVLEVLTGNEKAYEIYRGLGFDVRRRLLCPSFDGPPIPIDASPADTTIDEGPFDPSMLPRLPPSAYRPSWQYTDAAMVAIREKIHAVVVRDGDRIVGAGLAIAERPRIAQLRFDASVLDGPIPAAVVARLCRALDRRPVIAGNVDAEAEATIELLERCGFAFDVDQFEMDRRF